MARWRTRLGLGCAGIAGGVLVLAGLVVGLLGTRAGNAWLLARVLEAASGLLPQARLEASHLETDVLSTLLLEDARITDPEGEELIGVDRIQVRWSLAALLAGEAHLTAVEVDRPRVTVRERADGSLDLVEALGLGGGEPGEGWQGTPLPVRVDAVRVRDGAFAWTTSAGAWVVEALDLDAGVALEGRDVRVDDLRLGARLGSRPEGARAAPLLDLALGGSVALVAGDLEVGPLAARIAGAEIDLSGRVKDLEGQPAFTLALEARRVDPAAFAPLVGDLGISGPLALDAEAWGTLDALAGQAILTTPGGRLRAGMGVNLAQEPWPWNVVLDLDDVVPERVVAGLPEGTRLAGQVRVGGVGFGEGLRTAAHVELGAGSVAGVAFEAFEAEVQQDGPRIALERASLGTAAGEVRATGTVDAGSGAVDLALDVPRLDLAGLAALGASGLAGTGTAAGRVRWSGDAGLHGSGVVALADVEAAGVRLARLDGPWTVRMDEAGIEFEITAEVAEVTGPSLALDTGRVTVQGRLPPGGTPELTATLDATRLSVPTLAAERLTASASWSEAGVILALEARAGNGRPVAILEGGFDAGTGEVRAGTLVWAPIEGVSWANEGPVALTLTPGGVRDLAATLVSGGARIDLRGDLDTLGEVDLEVHANGVDLDPLGPAIPGLPEGIGGRVRLDLDLAGTFEALVARGQASVSGLVVPGAVRDLDAEFSFEAEQGEVGFLLEVPDAQGDRLARVEGRLPATLGTGGATLAVDRPWRLEALVAPGFLDRWSNILDLPDLPEGVASAHLVVEGTPGDPVITLGGAADVAMGEGERVRVELSARQDGDRIALDARMGQDMHTRATVSGTATTRLPQVARALVQGEAGPEVADPATWASDLDVAIVPLDLSVEALGRLLPGFPAALSGEMRGGLTVRGDPLAPRVEGGLQLAHARLGDVWLDDPTLELAPDGKGYRVLLGAGFGQGAQDGDLRIAGHVPLTLDRTTLDAALERPGLALEVTARVPLAVLDALSGSIAQAEGLLELSGRIEGSLGLPEPHLDVTLEDGAVTVRDLAVRYTGIQVDASLEGDRLEVRRIGATSQATGGGDAGSLSLVGSASFDAWRPELVAVKGQADAFRLVDRPDVRLVLTGWVAVSGLWPGLKVKGKLVADEARFEAGRSFWLGDRALALDPRIVLRRQAPAVPGDTAPPWYYNIAADVDVALEKGAWVDIEMPLDDRFGALYASLATMSLSSQLDGSLSLDLARGTPSLVGEVVPIRGRAQILGALFELKPGGRVAFTGRDVLDPMLGMEAVHDAGAYGEVEVDIGGSLDALTLAFSSTDWPDETDIAAILVLGRPLSEAPEGAGENGALALASGILAGELERTLGGLEVDMLRIDASATGGIGAAQVGQSIGRRLFLTVAWRPGADPALQENTLEATVEWSIGRAWTVEVRTGDQGASRADLFRTWRF
ncbi:MAG: translocation/assembly module TamB domain-containing protein [Deltaproteobacteria bacterium]|nr:translocation/assembly module TamB domain-containing protein [Deltaproteobacteria bacterium]